MARHHLTTIPQRNEICYVCWAANGRKEGSEEWSPAKRSMRRLFMSECDLILVLITYSWLSVVPHLHSLTAFTVFTTYNEYSGSQVGDLCGE